LDDTKTPSSCHWSLPSCRTLVQPAFNPPPITLQIFRILVDSLLQAVIYTIIISGWFLRYKEEFEDTVVQLGVARSLLDDLVASAQTSRESVTVHMNSAGPRHTMSTVSSLNWPPNFVIQSLKIAMLSYASSNRGTFRRKGRTVSSRDFDVCSGRTSQFPSGTPSLLLSSGRYKRLKTNSPIKPQRIFPLIVTNSFKRNSRRKE